ncbi:hypothetical protein AALP_AAs58241U000100 [Arabis alpina]|uniref:Sucrose-phosphatase C-terminal domain-containing protein n=1 Tax=Arabis alpina TaxID=50452 RepID=A0A087G134_ARAAL|nr:hypothetical protein AALP_AAs58241U000100 [Arabis alpina]
MLFLYPSGTGKYLRDTIEELGKHHGDQQGKKFRVWVDQILATYIIPGAWTKKLDKWEHSGDERRGCKTNCDIHLKEGEGLVWEHVEQTWSEESMAKVDSI